MKPKFEAQVEAQVDLSSNLGGAHPFCPKGNSSCPQLKLWIFQISSHLRHYWRKTGQGNKRERLHTIKSRRLSRLHSSSPQKTILSWKICTRLIGCSVLTPISGSVNLPFDYFLHSNTKVAVVRRLWQWGNSQNVLRFPPDRKTTRILERRTSHPLANELVLCVKDDKSPSTGRKLSCQQRQTGEEGLLYENQIIELWTLGSNSDLRCGGRVTIDSQGVLVLVTKILWLDHLPEARGARYDEKSTR